MDTVKDILLVSPNYNEKEIFNKNAHLPVGLAFIAQSIEDNFYGYDICDLTVQKEECLWHLLSNNNYKYIGFGMMSFKVDKSYAIIHKIKQLYPCIKIIIGGPHKCTFCGAPQFLGKKWRKKESNKIFEEFYYWYKKGYKIFKFEDSLFSADKKRIFEFCNSIIELGDKEVSFDLDGARCDHFNYDLLATMKKAGFATLVFGVESANDHVLKGFRKGETLKQIEETIALADKLNFKIGMFFIIGGPDETAEDVERSFRFALKYKNTAFVYFFELTPIKGTPYYDYAVEQKYISENTPYPSGNFGFAESATYGNNKMSKSEMSKMLKKARLIEKQVADKYKEYKYYETQCLEKNLKGCSMNFNPECIRTTNNIFTHLSHDEKIKLHELAKAMKENSNIVEIGSYLGASACILSLGAQSTFSKIICIDTWANDNMTEGTRDTYDEFLSNTMQFTDYIVPVKGFSYEVVDKVKVLTNSKIDLLFIDGDHSYEGVKTDWDLYSPMLRSGSIVIFHDVGWSQGVKRVIKEDVKPFVSKDSNFELPNMYWAWIK